MRFKNTLMLALATLAASPAFSQSDDFGIWTSLGVEKNLTKKLSAEAAFDFRSANNLENASRWSGAFGLSYKALNFLKLGAGYVYIYDYSPLETKVNFTNKGKVNGYNVDHGHWQNKHRVYFDATGHVKMGRFKLSLRERYQYTHTAATDCPRTRFRDEVQGGYTGETFVWEGTEFMEMSKVTDHKTGKDKHYLRSRVKIEYNIPKCPINPYASYELSNDLEDGLDLDKTRLIIGSEWKITKQHVLSAGYLYQHGTDGDHDGGRHVLDLSYRFKF